MTLATATSMKSDWRKIFLSIVIPRDQSVAGGLTDG